MANITGCDHAYIDYEVSMICRHCGCFRKVETVVVPIFNQEQLDEHEK